ncbi:hypothetical protein EIP91_011024 [Steccherinum ochraceum]|uniref:RING-type domain-containing protein n=1 Tax=Steccherinum ochraceum TaxID=92696 RepID=A0A4R0QZZ9_9APHY|nr:hypothetical protein EIP91_011024 [Steccherinum ochraceum]
MLPTCPVSLEPIRPSSNNITDNTQKFDDVPRTMACGHVVIRACIDGLQQDACPICRHPAERSTQVYKLCFQAEDPNQPAPPQAYIEKYIQDFFYQYEELKGVRERLQDEEERLQRYLAKTESHMTAAKRSQASLDKLNAQWNELSSERLSPSLRMQFLIYDCPKTGPNSASAMSRLNMLARVAAAAPVEPVGSSSRGKERVLP